ncbi:nucleotidyl transferase AbiEii/AbiGii toxin family protein [Treponema sp.]|uniref:nucleotidyl transferase AbiEii/AbiGii toxin family protein n=1 Tax=Treponema sp. TaxID=166 RepID=UPI003F0A7DB1
MYKTARYSEDDLRTLFRNTSVKAGLNEAIIEKDFWVCLMLNYLFHKCEYKDGFTFKGGTSLSKCFNLIKRFSEDIDLILDWRILGYGLNEPWQERSNSKQDKFNKEANARAELFLKETLLPVLQNDLKELLNLKDAFYIDDKDAQTICFKYPAIYKDDSILQIIRLEIGALAAWTPSVVKNVKPYAADYYPKIFETGTSAVRCTSVERSFWEKATILHHEANRPKELPMPRRYSRHYYDLYVMAHSEYKNSAFSRIDLLRKVAEFKMKFYPRKWAEYENAKIGTLKLVPPEYRLKALREDYENMEEMFYSDFPDFDKLMKYICELEKEINLLK